MKREEMIGFIVRSLDNMMMRNAVGDEKSEKKGMMPVMQGSSVIYMTIRTRRFFREILRQSFILPVLR